MLLVLIMLIGHRFSHPITYIKYRYVFKRIAKLLNRNKEIWQFCDVGSKMNIAHLSVDWTKLLSRHFTVHSVINCTDWHRTFHCIFYCQLYRWTLEFHCTISCQLNGWTYVMSLYIQLSIVQMDIRHLIVYSIINCTDGHWIFHCTFSCQLNRWTYDISLYIQLSMEQMDIG